MKKTILAAVLALLLILALPVLAEAEIVASGTCGNNVTWTMDAQGRMVVSGTGEMRGSYDGNPWSGVKTAVIQNGVTAIGYSAFKGCGELTGVTIPDSVTSIGENAFYECASLRSIDIPDSVTAIAGFVFYGCGSLSSVTIPDGVISIGFNSFMDCPAHRFATVGSSGAIALGKAHCSFRDHAYPKIDLEYRYDFGTFLGLTVTGADKDIVSVTFPDDVVCIDNLAFYECGSLTDITIPDTVTSIGNFAFYRCGSLSSLSIPDGVTSVGYWAFRECGAVISASLGSSGAKALGKAGVSFRNAAYPQLDLIYHYDGDALTGLFIQAADESIASVRFPNQLAGIDSEAFKNCRNLTSVTLPAGVTSIGADAFNGCGSLTSAVLPASVNNIGAGAFKHCGSLTSINIPAGVTSIADDTFFNCGSLASVTIPDSVTAIGEYAFYNCRNLTGIDLPAGVTAIEKAAFYNCSGLTSIVIPDGLTRVESSSFYQCGAARYASIGSSGAMALGRAGYTFCASAYPQIELIYRFDDGTDPALAVSGVSVYATSVVIPNGVTRINGQAFFNCGCLSEVTIPSSVTEIGDYAFLRCSSLQTVVLPASVTALGAGVFQECGSLQSVTLGSGVTEIGEYMFSECASLESLVIPEGVTGIGRYAFLKCGSLKSVYIPASVTDIGLHAFDGCADLVLHVVRDSYGHQCALEQGIAYVIQGEEETPPPDSATTVPEKVNEIVAKVIRPGMTDYQKALALHNYLIYHANYDYSLSYHSPEGVLLIGLGACQSYADAYALLLDAVGISNWQETGNSHIWNVALLDGSWCHIDATWDDPGSGGYETCTWFAVTDYAMQGVSSHERYNRLHPCDDYKVSYAYKNGVLGAIVNRWKEQILEKAANGEYDMVIQGSFADSYGANERMAYQMLCDTGVAVNGIIVRPETRFEWRNYSYQLYVTYEPCVQPAWTFVLPSKLKTVEEEAFMGIQADTVKIPSGCGAIGARAFAGSAIQAIYIPASVTAIGADAIPAGAAIFTPAGSAAAQWGRERGYTVAEIE